jgi:hypothetical protein
MPPKNLYQKVDESHKQHLQEQAARGPLCDCWVTSGGHGKWYKSVDETWCRNQSQPGSGTVGHIYPVGTAALSPYGQDSNAEG